MRVARSPDKPQSPDARPRRGRPPKIDTEQLLKVAREVFLERGLRATTSEVAERAHVAEGTLFHRFGTKDALFREAMQLSEEDTPQMLLQSLQRLEQTEHLELTEALAQMAEEFLEIGRIAIPLMMMSWSDPTSRPNNQCELHFRAFLKRLASYFEVQMDRGTLRRMDSELLARAYLGTIHHYCMARIVAPAGLQPMMPPGMFVRGLVDLLLHGCLLPSDSSADGFSSGNSSAHTRSG